MTGAFASQVGDLRQYVERLHNSDNVNVKAIKDRLRHLKNIAESCKTIPRDFRGEYKWLLNTFPVRMH